MLYLSMKFAYLVLISCHLLIFKYFLGSLDFALGFVRDPGNWEESGHFPRVTVCDFTVYKYAQPMNFTIECVLPLNMFNEKIFVFFFFWLCMLLALTIFSIFLWLGRISVRQLYFRRLLDINIMNERKISKPDINVQQDEAKKSLLEDDCSIANSSFKQFSSFGPDLRIVLGLLQDQCGLLFCTRVFREICNCNVRESNERTNKQSAKNAAKRAVSFQEEIPSIDDDKQQDD